MLLETKSSGLANVWSTSNPFRAHVFKNARAITIQENNPLPLPSGALLKRSASTELTTRHASLKLIRTPL
jgi:hypothetical protein